MTSVTVCIHCPLPGDGRHGKCFPAEAEAGRGKRGEPVTPVVHQGRPRSKINTGRSTPEPDRFGVMALGVTGTKVCLHARRPPPGRAVRPSKQSVSTGQSMEHGRGIPQREMGTLYINSQSLTCSLPTV